MASQRNGREKERIAAVRGFQRELAFRALIGAGTLTAGLTVHGIGWVPMPLYRLTVACLFVMLVNIPYYYLLEKSRRPERLVTLFLALDVCAISLLIHATGGVNASVLILGYPLVIIYASVSLPSSGTYVLALCSVVSYLLLFRLEGVTSQGTIGADYSFSSGYAHARAVAAVCLLSITAWFSTNFSRTLKRANRKLYRARQEVELRTQELVRSEKSAALGRLAAAMAHEINKPNFVIRNLAEILKEDVTLDESTREESLSAILRQAANIERSVGRLLSFAKPKTHEHGWVDLNGLLEESLNTLKKITPAGVEFRTEFVPGLPRVFADRIQLQQLVSNLVINAVQSVGASGRILVQGRRLAEKSGETPDGCATGAAGTEEWFQITVSDTGPGIPAENLERIFEPYFTTKPEGQGYGLGLAICQEIAAAHGGTLRVESREGQGSRFCVTLPLVQERREEPRNASG